MRVCVAILALTLLACEEAKPDGPQEPPLPSLPRVGADLFDVEAYSALLAGVESALRETQAQYPHERGEILDVFVDENFDAFRQHHDALEALSVPEQKAVLAELQHRPAFEQAINRLQDSMAYAPEFAQMMSVWVAVRFVPMPEPPAQPTNQPAEPAPVEATG